MASPHVLANGPDPRLADRGYALPEKLVSTEWVAERLDEGNLVLLESNEDPLLYSQGHIPGANEVDWVRDLNDPLRRDYLGPSQFAALTARLGITPESVIVFYGDKNNWWATYALWVFELFGVRAILMDGGRSKWIAEGRPLTRELPIASPTEGIRAERDDRTNRAFRDEVLRFVEAKGKMVDVRSPQEFDGTRLHMEMYPNEGAIRGGHIPGAANIPWAKSVNPDTGEFLPAPQLRSIYSIVCGEVSEPVITYCRIGERSSHTWFALKYLLGYSNVRNYDGSWTEWGNLVGAPIER